MKKLSYITKLHLAARWFLPQEEAEEVVADYREMLADGEDEKAEERFGPPVKVVLGLAGSGKALIWNLFLAGALVIHFFLVHWVCNYTYYNLAALTLSAVIVGLLLGLLGVEKFQNPFKGLPKSLLIVMILFLVLIIAMFTPAYYLIRFYHNPYPWPYAERFYYFLYGCVMVFSFISIVGIVLARLKDKRWRAVSILSLTVMIISMYFLSGLQNMDPSGDPVMDIVLRNHEGIFIAVAGIFAAGVGLC